MVAATRKGATRVADVGADILAELHAGRMEAATLAENLATDFSLLLTNVLPELTDEARTISPQVGITKRMAAVAALIIARYGAAKQAFLAGHGSDLVRGWGAYVVAALPGLTLADRIKSVRCFADDSHFGVREWAWLAVRPHIVGDPTKAIDVLHPWVGDRSERIRRFAIEATRPRGVWSAHIRELKSDPSAALPLLRAVKSDPSRYVQDSVANWLNDAWKTQPDWVEALCRDWTAASNTDQTQYIVKRALRNKP